MNDQEVIYPSAVVNFDGIMERPTIGINGHWLLPIMTATVNDTVVVYVSNQLGKKSKRDLELRDINFHEPKLFTSSFVSSNRSFLPARSPNGPVCRLGLMAFNPLRRCSSSLRLSVCIAILSIL